MLYQPRIKDDLIRKLHHTAKARGKKMIRCGAHFLFNDIELIFVSEYFNFIAWRDIKLLTIGHRQRDLSF